MHSIYIRQGVHFDPVKVGEITKEAKYNLFVVVNPPKNVLKSRIISRWEREKGYFSHSDCSRVEELFETNYKIQEYIVMEAEKRNFPVIHTGNREMTFNEFSNVLRHFQLAYLSCALACLERTKRRKKGQYCTQKILNREAIRWSCHT